MNKLDAFAWAFVIVAIGYFTAHVIAYIFNA